MVTETMTLDEAWSAAEQDLPEYWRVRSLYELRPFGDWEAVATDGHSIRRGIGSTPTEALRSLTPSAPRRERTSAQVRNG